MTGQAASVAIVTGGSRGIGRACALALAEAGHVVVVNWRADEAAAHATVKAIAGKGGAAVAMRGDMSVEAEIVALFEAADRLGPLKVLVNNAGVVDYPARVDGMDAARVTRMMAVNVVGPFLCAREALRRMSTKHGGVGGAIVNISSAAARLGSPGLFVDYAASKAAVDTFTLGLGLEVAVEGVRVNAVRPGLIDTDIHASMGEPDRAARLSGQIPIRRVGSAEEVARAVAWLASDAASYVTATTLDVSGGR